MKTSAHSWLAMFKGCTQGAVFLSVSGIFCSIALAAPTGQMARSGNSRQALLQADHAFVEATSKADKSSAESLVDSQFTWTNRDGKTWNRARALAAWKTLAETAGGESGFEVRVYGRVGFITGIGRRGNRDLRFGRIWVRQARAWKLMVYQENPILTAPAPSAPTAGDDRPATCINPCKKVPYEPRTAAVQKVIASWQALETANFDHNAAGWAEHVSDDFMLIRPSGQVLDKADRMATLRQQKANSEVVHVPTAQWVTVRMFGDTAVMVAGHHLENGTPYRATRVWILRDGIWKLAFSQQTIIR